VSTGQADGHLVSVLYEVADDRDLPEAARGGENDKPIWPHCAALIWPHPAC